MDDFLDMLKFLGMVILTVAIVLFFVWAAKENTRIVNERECYKIYATDNVILKKCEKYFDMGQ